MKQSALSLYLLVSAIMGVLAFQSVPLAAGPLVPQGQGDAHPLPLIGYDFSDQGSDAHGAFDLTLHGDANTVYDPQRGDVLQLQGTGYALAGDADLAIGDAMSVCFWVKEGPNCPDRNVLVGQGWDYDMLDHTFSVYRHNKQKFRWNIVTENRTIFQATHINNGDQSVDVSDGQWHHIAVTYDAGNSDEGRKIYIDGQLDGVFSGFGPVDSSFAGVSVGHIYPGIPHHLSPFVGWLDDVGFYDTSLTQAQIQDILVNGLSGYNPGLPVYVSPLDGADLTQNRLTLQWQVGLGSVSHNVYLSQDRGAVAGQLPEAFLGNQTADHIEVSGLDWATTYYWRVDEVNEAHEDSPWLGPIWSFTTLGTLMIDDIESYGLEHPFRIFETWLDRLGYTADGQPPYTGNGTGMTVGEYNEQAGGYLGSVDVVYEGWFSMPLAYDNTQAPYYSEAQRAFEPPVDWTTNGHNDMAYLCLHHIGTVPPPSDYELSGEQHHVTGVWAESFDDLGAFDKLNKTDHCTFVSMPMQGDGTLTVQVESVEDTDAWARAGIMIREDLTENAPHMAAVVTPSGLAEYLYRQSRTGGTRSLDTGEPNSIAVPHWLRLTRQGSLFTAEHSGDGAQWERLGFAFITMPNDVHVGLMVNSFVDGETPCQAVFSHLQVNGVEATLETLTNIGRAENDPDHLYVAVQDAHAQQAVVVHPDDPNALLVDDWTEWRLPLSQLEAQGIDLTQITQLAIGVGDTPQQGEVRSPGGSGQFYVDQIRLMADE